MATVEKHNGQIRLTKQSLVTYLNECNDFSKDVDGDHLVKIKASALRMLITEVQELRIIQEEYEEYAHQFTNTR